MLIEDIKKEQIDVIAVTKKKDSSFIYFDDQKIKVHTSTIEEFNIKANDVLDKEKINKIKRAENKIKIKKYIKNLINKRPYTEHQLYEKAVLKFDDFRLVREAIKELKEEGLGADKDYIENYLEYFDIHNFGKYYIINYFRDAGISQEIIDSLEFENEREIEKAWDFFNSIKNKYTSKNFVKQKKQIFNLMLKRGFPVSVIDDVLSKLEIDEEDENKKLLKDYKRVSEKYALKYSGRVLKNKIITKLISLGYRLENIQELVEEDVDYEY